MRAVGPTPAKRHGTHWTPSSNDRQRPSSPLTLFPNVQPNDPSQLIDQVISPLICPPTLFQACETSDGGTYPPPAPGCAGSPGTWWSYGTLIVVPWIVRPLFRHCVWTWNPCTVAAW